MKLSTLALAFALALALPVVTALPVPAPVGCADPCTIAASSAPGYNPPIAVISAGSSVVWHSTDVTHLTRDTGVTAGAACFQAIGEGGADAPPVRFDVVDGALVATIEGEPTTCTNAVGDAAGGFALGYFCTIHPTMRAALVVAG